HPATDTAFGFAIRTRPSCVSNVAQTSESAGSQVSKPAGRSTEKDVPDAGGAQPTGKSALPQTRRSALRQGAPTLVGVAIIMLSLGFVPRVPADDLDDAFAHLVEGRSYLKDFPTLKTRDQLVDDFIAANGQSPNRPNLLQAIDGA